MIPSKPVQRTNERTLAYYHRVNEWEKLVKPMMQREARAIDSSCKTPAISTHKATTRQVAYDRLTIHDHAQKNPVLLRILRRIDCSKL